jgi:hypothetical protein
LLLFFFFFFLCNTTLISLLEEKSMATLHLADQRFCYCMLWRFYYFLFS